MTINLQALQVGDALPALALPPLTRHTLALYCSASGDHNPIHVDLDYARAAGLPDVIAHGMLSAAWLARMVMRWVPQPSLRALDIRFAAPTQVGERITCRGHVVEKRADCLRVQLETVNEAGQVKLSGEARLALPTNP
jgi:acyl dehydratase